MKREEILKNMDFSAKEDRERFFAVADTLMIQPKYAACAAELEALKQQWRDMTALPDYPNIEWPPLLPDWFPKVKFASTWKKNIYIEQAFETSERKKAPKPDMQ